MKKYSILLTCIVVLIFCSVLSVQAQNQDGLKAKIPFSFMVGQKEMPAGSYIVTRLNDNSPDFARVFRSVDGHHTAIVLAGGFERKVHGKPALVFHRYGNTYFLSSVRSNTVAMNFHSSAEAKVAGKTKSSPAIIAAN